MSKRADSEQIVPYPGRCSGVKQLMYIVETNHVFYDNSNQNGSRLCDPDQHMHGNVPSKHQLSNLILEARGTISQSSSVYNKQGARFLAKNVPSRDPQTRAMTRENGRTYQGQGIDSYMLPCDETEMDRLDFIHAVFMRALGSARLIHVPHATNGRFLDLGCGTGIWAVEVARAYPDAYILGVDISSIQPVFRSPNCVFKAPFNYELPWLFGEGRWDIIHLRMGSGSVTNWPRLYRRVYDHLRCGAWFEQLEIVFEPRYSDPQLEHGLSPLRSWYESLKTATEKSKRSIANSPEQTLRWLRDAGFSDVSYETVNLPLNPQNQPVYKREAARWYQMAFVESIEPLCLAPFSRVLGWTRGKIQTVMAAASAEALDPSSDVFHTLYIYKARRL